MSSIRMKDRYGENSTDPILSFLRRASDVGRELSSLQIELGKARGSVDTKQLCTLLENIQNGGSANDLIDQLLRGLAVVRARLSVISYNTNC